MRFITPQYRWSGTRLCSGDVREWRSRMRVVHLIQCAGKTIPKTTTTNHKQDKAARSKMSNNAAKKEEPTAGPSSGAPKVEEKKKLPQLGALEDDDEFEEFSADGESLVVDHGFSKQRPKSGGT
jgi:hypothetical protein